MKKSSIIILAVCAFLLIFLVMVYIPLRGMSQENFTQQDAEQMVAKMAEAFEDKSSARLLSYVSPDANVAGRNLENIHRLLQQYFSVLKNPKVNVSNTDFNKEGETAQIRADVAVKDEGASADPAASYRGRIGFTIKRVPEPHLLGLMTIYRWKITEVDAPNIPTGLGF
jgi:hypothetical protein